MSESLVVLPIVGPLALAIILLCLHGRLALQRLVAAIGTVGVLGACALLFRTAGEGHTLVMHVGAWPPPFGIVLVADRLSSFLVLVAMATSFLILLYAFAALDRDRERTFFHPLFQILLMGVNGSFLTGDLFNLFVFFEVLLVCSYVLLTLGSEPYQLQEGFKYVVLNVIASALFLVGVAVVYASLGTLNLADMAVKSAAAEHRGLLGAASLLFLIVFGIKAALFPLYFWLPRAYFATPTVITALFGGLLSKVGVYAIVRLYTLVWPADPPYLQHILLWVAGLTMVAGVVTAVAQIDYKRILAYHIISQIGYMILGLAIGTPLALAGGILHIVHNQVVKTALFLTAGIAERLTGTTHLKRLGGLVGPYPGLAWVFLIAAFALAGVPPLSGFFSKFLLVRGGIEAGHYMIVAVAMGVSLLTLFSMIKIYRLAYWGESTFRRAPELLSRYRALLVPAGGLTVVAIAIGLGAPTVTGYVLDIAGQLLEPNVYVQAVLGTSLP